MLSSEDALPQRPNRVVIAGVSGVGKTSLAARISRILDIPHTEIDALFHGPNWLPRDAFLTDVEALVAKNAWVTEWQYSSAQQILAGRADVLVWLDLPFLTVTLPRVIQRTIRRRLGREELWNGNVEGPFYTFLTDREHIVRWAWSTRKKYREKVPALETDFPNLTVVRLCSQQEVERWLTRQLRAQTDGRPSTGVAPEKDAPGTEASAPPI